MPGYEPPHNTGPLPQTMQGPSFGAPAKGMLGANGGYQASTYAPSGLAGLAARRPVPVVAT
jgi:hypothetical protein